MSTVTLNTNTSHAGGFRTYLTDVSNAARAFAAALFAAQERQFVAQEVVAKPNVSERLRLKNHRSLFAMAKDYEHMHPNLAAELRNLAGRD